MSRSGKGYEIGRGRPPKATQWKKGKSANPGGRSSPRPTGLLEMIDKLLLTSIRITRDGVSKRVTTLEAILEQLWSKGIAGDRQRGPSISDVWNFLPKLQTERFKSHSPIANTPGLSPINLLPGSLGDE